MYGMIGRLHVVPGRRKKLGKLLTEAIGRSPGCLAYAVKKDPDDKHVLWIQEVWLSPRSYRRSMERKQVKKAIKKGKEYVEGGYGTHLFA